jgi:hypothetical protein
VINPDPKSKPLSSKRHGGSERAMTNKKAATDHPRTFPFEPDKRPSHEMALDKTGGFHFLERAADLAAPEL